MKTTKKARIEKSFAALLVVAAFALAPLGVWAKDIKATVGDLIWSYSVHDSVATITGVERTTVGDRVEGSITVPGKFDEIPVVEIGYRAFLDQEFVTKVVLPEGITSLDAYSFYGCKRLTTLVLPSTVRTIFWRAFEGCSSLKNLTLNEGLTEIGESAFEGCAALKELTLPSTVQTLGSSLFSELPIRTMEIPDSVTEIGVSLFAGCDKLESVVVGKRVPELPYRMFAGCEMLTSVTLKEGYLDQVDAYSFYGCKRLTTLVLPSTVRTICYRAFEGCTALRSVMLNEGLTEIGDAAFDGCTALHYVYFQGDMPEVGNDIFSDVPDRMMVYISGESSGFGDALEGHPVRLISEKPADADNLYDFYVYPAKATISGKNYQWSLMVMTNRYVHGRVVPQSIAKIREGDPVYLSYAFDEYWRGESFVVTNRFTLKGAAEATFDERREASAESTDSYFWTLNSMPDALQNLAPGNYALTLRLNDGFALAETDSSNNTVSVKFTVVPASRCKVTLKPCGGKIEGDGVVRVEKGNALGKLPVPVRAGYTFDGWFTKSSGGTKVKSSAKITKDVTYYAQWTVNKYKIAFNANGGKGTMKTISATYDKSVTLTANAFKRSNCTFLGWATRKDATKAEYADKQKVKNLSDKNGKTVTLYVVWKHNTYTVKFNANGGTGATVKQTVNCGDKTALGKNTFTREGFVFAGWATKKDGKVVYKNKAKVTDLAKNGKSITLYAVWNPAEWAVGTFTGKGEIAGKAASVALTVASDGKISGKFTRKSDKKAFSFKADKFEGFSDGALRATTTLKYGSKTCGVEIAVGQDTETGETIREIALTYKGALYGWGFTEPEAEQ